MRGSTGREVDREVLEPVGIVPAQLKKVKPADMAIRFVFGAGIALVAGLVGMRFGPLMGGLFLAFPAVLPASLTLLEKNDGREKADIDALGAILGSCGMVAFAAAIVFGMPRIGPLPAAAAGGLGWAAVAGALFLAVRTVLVHR
jgi:Protein of unknown function (DUF3147)